MKPLSASSLAAYLYINISLRISSIEKALIPNILMIMDETYIELLCCILCSTKMVVAEQLGKFASMKHQENLKSLYIYRVL